MELRGSGGGSLTAGCLRPSPETEHGLNRAIERELAMSTVCVSRLSDCVFVRVGNET